MLISAAAAGKSYKEQKEIERRARAGDSVGWNASFVRSDTVVDALADRLGVGKSDILDREEVSRGCMYTERPRPRRIFSTLCWLRGFLQVKTPPNARWQKRKRSKPRGVGEGDEIAGAEAAALFLSAFHVYLPRSQLTWLCFSLTTRQRFVPSGRSHNFAESSVSMACSGGDAYLVDPWDKHNVPN